MTEIPVEIFEGPGTAPAPYRASAAPLRERLFQHIAALAMVGLATCTAVGLKAAVGAPNVTLIFVLPVTITAAAFGWGPALTAVASGVLAYDFFLTAPYHSFVIDSLSDLCAAILLLVVAMIVSVIAAEGRRAVQDARRSTARALTMQSLAHMVIEEQPEAAVTQAAATALAKIFETPVVILVQRTGRLWVAASARQVHLTSADLEAAKGALETGVRARAGSYPYADAGLDFWRIASHAGEPLLLGIKLHRRRSEDPEAYVEMVGAYLAAVRARRKAAPTRAEP